MLPVINTWFCLATSRRKYMHCLLLTFEFGVETLTIVHGDSQEQVNHESSDDDTRQRSCAQQSPTKTRFQINPQMDWCQVGSWSRGSAMQDGAGVRPRKQPGDSADNLCSNNRPHSNRCVSDIRFLRSCSHLGFALQRDT